MKKSSKILSLLLVLFLLIQTFAVGSFAIAPTVPEEAPLYAETRASYVANWGEREELCTSLSTYATNFYSGSYTFDNLATLDGGGAYDAYNSELYKSLQTLMESRHSYQTSYDATKNLYMYTDCQNGDTSKISSFYSGMIMNSSWGSGWNREHTWPNSKGLGGMDENDIMMLRPTSTSENSSRGNNSYGTASGYYDPNRDSNGAHNLHGDVARICLYVYVRWGNHNIWGHQKVNGVWQGNFESLSLLLQWMAEDPVDTWEMGRNDAVQSITGTRNVFVDYPEFAWLLFGRDVPTDIATPSGKASGGLLGGGSGDNPGTDNPGTDNPGTDTPTLTTPEEILEAAYDLGVGETLGQYTLTGVITALDSYNNPTIVVNGHDDMPIYCYKLKDDRFVIGATITVTGTIKNYEGKVEFDYCTLDSFTAPSNPGTDNPGIDNPGTDNPGTDNPGTDNPGTDNPGTDNPGTDNPGTDNPGTDNPGTDNPGTDTPTTVTKDDFLDAYTAIFAYKGEAKFNQICKALTYYAQLSEDDKSAVSAEYGALLTAANSYNEEADAINGEMSAIHENILYCVTIMSVLCAAAYVIGKKIF